MFAYDLDGKEYHSLKDMCTVYGVDYQTCYRLVTEKRVPPGEAVRILSDGGNFNSVPYGRYYGDR